MEGFFPPRAKSLVKEFILKNKDELLEMWETGIYHKISHD